MKQNLLYLKCTRRKVTKATWTKNDDLICPQNEDVLTPQTWLTQEIKVSISELESEIKKAASKLQQEPKTMCMEK